MNRRVMTLLATGLFLLALAAGVMLARPYSLRQQFELAGFQSVVIAAESRGGNLSISGGAAGLVDGTFVASTSLWQPGWQLRGVAGRQSGRMPDLSGTYSFYWGLQTGANKLLGAELACDATVSDLSPVGLALTDLNLVLDAGEKQWEKELVTEVVLALPR